MLIFTNGVRVILKYGFVLHFYCTRIYNNVFQFVVISSSFPRAPVPNRKTHYLDAIPDADSFLNYLADAPETVTNTLTATPHAAKKDKREDEPTGEARTGW
jgi:hypothetical protein